MAAHVPAKSGIKGPIVLGSIFGALAVFGDKTFSVDRATSSVEAASFYIGEFFGPIVVLTVLWLIFNNWRKGSTEPDVPAAEANQKAPEPRPTSMAVRLGEVIYWAACAVSVIIAIMVIVALANGSDKVLSTVAILLSIIVFAAGKAVRYVLAGY